MLEVHDGGPIVGEVLGKRAGRAGGLISDVTSHVRVQGVAAHELVDMTGRRPARLYQGIEPLDRKSGASEPEGCLRWHSESRSEYKRKPLHPCKME